MMRNSFLIAAVLAVAAAGNASASWPPYLVISRAATENVTCSGGTCMPTGPRPAVLNVGDLENLLASGNVQVVTRGGRFGMKGSISVGTPLSWAASTSLTLQAAQQVRVDARVSVKGSGGLTVGSYIAFGPKGRITFSNLSSSLVIRSNSYVLVGTLPSLASAIAANPSGFFALANSYDASADGTYSASPIPTNFLGYLEGLGNTISNIAVNNTSACCVGGLFLNLSEAVLSDLRLKNVAVTSSGGAAGLAYESFAQINNTSITGTIAGGDTGDMGGLVSDNYGAIYGGYSAAAVSAGSSVTDVNVGGLVGVNLGGVGDAFATGNVSAGNGSGTLGGLVGLSQGGVDSCYANGAITGGTGMKLGGLIGWNPYESGGGFTVAASYSIGAVSGGSDSIVGGFIGENEGDVEYGYWDTDTSGTDVGVALGNASGVTGLTTEQLQSGLPSGFERNFWAEKAGINNGFPYLIANPPPR